MYVLITCDLTWIPGVQQISSNNSQNSLPLQVASWVSIIAPWRCKILGEHWATIRTARLQPLHPGPAMIARNEHSAMTIVRRQKLVQVEAEHMLVSFACGASACSAPTQPDFAGYFHLFMLSHCRTPLTAAPAPSFPVSCQPARPLIPAQSLL
jgi:hypothetical protein